MPYNYLYAKLYFVYISYFAQKLKLSMKPENAPAGRTAGAAILAGFSAGTDQRLKSKFVLDKRRPAPCTR